MSGVSDLVRDSKLDTQFFDKYITHRFDDLDPDNATRHTVRKEYWSRRTYIGGGAHGRVWLEKCIKGARGHDVRAVKEIYKSPSARKHDYYNYELEAIAKFSHARYVRCFVKSFGWYERDDVIYIAMEYYPLGDLSSHLASSAALSEGEVKEIVFQLLEGLSFLHENGFAHRDLKPSNIMIKARPPDKWWVKIGDFGISKRATGNDGSSTVKGTLAFMPPEVHGFVAQTDCCDGAQAGACAADMWALGEVTYQLLTNEPCFRNMKLLSTYVSDSELFPAHVLKRQGISPDGINFVRALMVPRPKQRMSVNMAISHAWLESCKVPSPKALSLISIESFENNEDSILNNNRELREPSGRWSTVSALRVPNDRSTNENNTNEEPDMTEHMPMSHQLQTTSDQSSHNVITTRTRRSTLDPVFPRSDSALLESTYSQDDATITSARTEVHDLTRSSSMDTVIYDGGDSAPLDISRKPTLMEILARRSVEPYSLFDFYLYMRDVQRSVDYLDFWLDVSQHLSLFRHFVRELKRQTKVSPNSSSLSISSTASASANTVARADISSSAEKILYTYILPGSERQIALPNPITDKMIRDIEMNRQDEPEVFEEAKTYVFQAMENDAYPGFMKPGWSLRTSRRQMKILNSKFKGLVRRTT